MQDDAIETTDNRVTLVAKLMNTLMNTRTQIKNTDLQLNGFFHHIKILVYFLAFASTEKIGFLYTMENTDHCTYIRW